MIPEFWTSRDEAYLAAILGESVELPEPQTRLEMFLAKIAGMDVTPPEPQARAEIYLAAILGANVALPVPLSRVDFYLAKVAGMDVETPEPLTRIDEYLAEWAENGSGEIVTVTGTSPLVLANAMAHAIRKLVQFGKCTTSGGDIYCNNGKLVAVDDELPVGYKRIDGIKFDGDFYYSTGESLSGDDDVTMTLANTSTTGQNVFGSYNGTSAGTKNFSLFIYGGGSQSNSYFRYGEQLLRPRFGTGERTITFGKSGTDGFATDVSGTPETFTTPANAYIGMLPNSTSPAFTGSIIGNILIGTRLKYIPVERESDGVIGYFERVKGNFIAPTGSGTPVSLGYDTSHLNILSVEGTPEVLTIGTQTAHVEDLFEVNGVADEQDIISGTVTRRVEVSVSGGVIALSALAEPVTEQTTPQPLSTVEGTNTVAWTAEVSGTVKEVEYAYEAPSFEWKTASGAVVSVNDAIAGEVGALTVSINPVQDLHGYSNPWPAGGGINKLPPAGSTTPVTNGNLTVTPYADGHYHIKKTADTSNRGVSIDLSATVDVTTALYFTPLASVVGTGAMICNLRTSENSGLTSAYVSKASSLCTADGTAAKLYFYFTSGTEYEGDVWPMVTPTAVAAWSPYENICPISGWTEVKIWREVTHDTSANPALTIELDGTVYGGTLDVLTGVLTARPYYASYNGETLVGPWVSSMDKYVAGATPTTGAQVVDLGGTPTTVQLDPAQLTLLAGENYVWCDTGDISLTYKAAEPNNKVGTAKVGTAKAG